MNRRISLVLAASLVAVIAAGLIVSSAMGQQQQPPPQPSPRGQDRQAACASALPQQAVDAILANHRQPLQAAREAVLTQERALRNLLVADNTTRTALDAQIARANEARNMAARARINALWDLRSVIPAQDRQVAFRCAERLLSPRGTR